jgi:hypothetical protein
MNGKINGVEVSARGKDVPRIPDEYWHGEMTSNNRNSSMVLLINIKISLKSHLDIKCNNILLVLKNIIKNNKK